MELKPDQCSTKLHDFVEEQDSGFEKIVEYCSNAAEGFGI